MKLDLPPEGINMLVMALDTSMQAMSVLRSAIVAQAQAEQAVQVQPQPTGAAETQPVRKRRA